MNQQNLAKIKELRKLLHQNAEPSCQEVKTRAILQQFLKENTSLEIVDRGRWFYAVHREGDDLPGIAFRADFDAIIAANGQPAHLCGHDGHSAGLAGVALELEGKTFGKNIFLLFQHAEENGAGAIECCDMLRTEKIQEIYGWHNYSGMPKGAIVLKDGVVMSASMGMTIAFEGRQSHASEPERGINPAFAIARIIDNIDEFIKADQYSGMVLCTVIGTTVGAPTFGVSPSKGELWLTIRAHRDEDLNKLKQRIIDFTQGQCREMGMSCSFSYCDVFPDTTNHKACADKVRQMCQEQSFPLVEMPEPKRGSEDFGHYLKLIPGAFYFIGDGEDHPNLHSQAFEFPDEILERGVESFLALAKMEML